MCLEGFQEFKTIKKSDAVIGYRIWLLNIKNEDAFLKSASQEFFWNKKQGVGNHKVTKMNSGIYSYNNYNYDNYDNNYNYNYYYRNYNNYYKYYNNNNYNYYEYYYHYNNYYIIGIIKQWGRVAIHSIGYRSQYASIDTLFTIRKSDASGPQEFLDWIDKFNQRIEKLAKFHKCKIVTWQDFVEQKKNESPNSN